jgi:hypothetical protein
MEDGTMEKEIDGITFTVTPFQAVEALKLKAFLVRKFAPSLGQALGTLKDGIPESGRIGDIKLDGTELSRALEKLMEQLDSDEFINLIMRMFQNVQASFIKDSKPVLLTFGKEHFNTSLDIVFQGRLFSIYPVMLLVLEANFPDFFGKTAGIIGEKIRKTFGSAEEGKELMTESGKSET